VGEKSGELKNLNLKSDISNVSLEFSPVRVTKKEDGLRAAAGTALKAGSPLLQSRQRTFLIVRSEKSTWVISFKNRVSISHA